MKWGAQVGDQSTSRTGPKSGVTSATEPFNKMVKDCVRCSRGAAVPGPAFTGQSWSPIPNIIHKVFIGDITISYYPNPATKEINRLATETALHHHRSLSTVNLGNDASGQAGFHPRKKAARFPQGWVLRSLSHYGVLHHSVAEMVNDRGNGADAAKPFVQTFLARR